MAQRSGAGSPSALVPTTAVPRALLDRVLLAEADAGMRQGCLQWLSFPGREVVAVEPRAAAALLGRERWDALVLGWSGGPGEAYAMALATGLPAAERPAVVLMARDVSGPGLRTAFRAGATDVVGVPFDPRHLAAVVLAAMGEVLSARPRPTPVPTPVVVPAPVPVRALSWRALFDRLRAETAGSAVVDPPTAAPQTDPKDHSS